MKSDTRNIPLACNMNVFTPSQRDAHLNTISQVFQTIQSVQEAENGFEFVFPSQADIQKIGEFISNEKLCCPFLSFTLKVESNTPISLILAGPEGIHEFLRAEFSEAFS